MGHVSTCHDYRWQFAVPDTALEYKDQRCTASAPLLLNLAELYITMADVVDEFAAAVPENQAWEDHPQDGRMIWWRLRKCVGYKKRMIGRCGVFFGWPVSSNDNVYHNIVFTGMLGDNNNLCTIQVNWFWIIKAAYYTQINI